MWFNITEGAQSAVIITLVCGLQSTFEDSSMPPSMVLKPPIIHKLMSSVVALLPRPIVSLPMADLRKVSLSGLSRVH